MQIKFYTRAQYLFYTYIYLYLYESVKYFFQKKIKINNKQNLLSIKQKQVSKNCTFLQELFTIKLKHKKVKDFVATKQTQTLKVYKQLHEIHRNLQLEMGFYTVTHQIIKQKNS